MSRNQLPSSSHVKSRLPSELYRYILQNITTPNDLFSLCTTSKFIYGEAERVLYDDVDLHGCSNRQIQSWSMRVADCPRVAALVRKLCLPSTGSPGLTSNGVEYVVQSMLRALRAVFNVTELTIRPYALSTSLLEHCYYSAEMTHEYSFRLRKFHVEGDFLLFGANPLPFLASQPEIRDWKSGSLVQVVRNPPANLLPHITIVQCAYRNYYSDYDLLRHISSRPNMERIRIDLEMALSMDDVYRIARTLRSCQQTLTHFHLTSCASSPLMPWSAVDLISSLADYARGLKFLRYSVTMDYKGNKLGCHRSRLLRVLPQFQHLATIIIDPLQCLTADDPRCFNWQLNSDARGLEVAEEIMSSCLSLHRVAFKVPNGQTKRYHCYLKSENDHVEFEGFDIVNDSSWKEM